jgi:hypothetical protein
MAEGQELGIRNKYSYTMDDGSKIKLLLDKTLGDVSGNGLTTLALTDNAGNKPLKFKPRVVFVQRRTPTNRIVRKSIVCSLTATLYKSNMEQNVTIDGDVYNTVGRRGETLTL